MNRLAVTIDGQDYVLEVRQSRAAHTEYEVTIAPGSQAEALSQGDAFTVYVPSGNFDGLEWIVVDQRPYEVVCDRHLNWLQSHSGRHQIAVRDLLAAVERPPSGDGRIKAPIPGLINRLMVKPGDQVELGQPLLVLEAMKMENEIQAPRSGEVRRVAVESGQTVTLNELLIEID
ncbi:MAG: biotin/lipoyl-binding protein [Caldilineaceae bacterium]|nr:biotin/lipoyl-binding protein [Caldilineaceae bacterium]